MISRLRFIFVLMVSLGLSPGCIIDTVPLPEDNPGAGKGAQPPGSEYGAPLIIDPSKVFYTAQGSGGVLLVGTASAVPGPGTIYLINHDKKVEHRFNAAEAGSFTDYLTAEVNDELEINFVVYDVVLDTERFTLGPPSVAALRSADDLDSALGDPMSGGEMRITFQVAVEDALVTITGEPQLLPPGIVIVVANSSRPGIAAHAAVALDGSFTLTIEGAAGDEMTAFAVEPAASNGAASSITLVVP